MVPGCLVDADIDAVQTCESSCGGAKSAIPGVFISFGGNLHVQVEASESEGFGARGEGVDMGYEFGEEGRILEGEFVGGIKDVVRFVKDLSACAEETDGQMHWFW